MIKLAFDLEDDLYHELKRVAKAIGMSYSALIRRSLEVAVKQSKYRESLETKGGEVFGV